MKLLTKNILSVVVALAIVGIGLGATVAHAQFDDKFCQVQGSQNTSFCQNQSNGTAPANNELVGPNGIINKAVSWLTIATGTISVIMVIIGGIKYTTSDGDSGKITSAKSTVIYALAGLVISMLARQIIIFVLNRL